MEHITFSDSLELSGRSTATVEFSDSSETAITSIDDYCKKNPDALECREYDV